MSGAKMSSRERMVAALKREDPDYIPCSLQICQGPWWKEPFFWHDQIERAERCLELGLDPTIDIWLPDPEPHPDVEIRSWRERQGEDILITKEYHTPAGVLRQTVKETGHWCDTLHGLWQPTTFGSGQRTQFGVDLFDDHNVSRRTEPWVKGPEDLEKLRYIIRPPQGYALDEWRMDAERALEFAEKYQVLTTARRTIVGDAFQWFCDIPWFMLQLYDDPEFVEEFLGIFQEWSLRLVDLVLEVGVDLVQYRGWYETPTYWGVKGFQRHLVPLIEEQCQLVHAAGKLHSYLLPEGYGAYADVLKEMDSDAIYSFDPRMLHGGDLPELFAKLGDCWSFWGGVNAEVALHSGDPEVIDKAVRDAIEILGGNGGLILSAMMFHGVSEESILLMIQAWRKYRAAWR